MSTRASAPGAQLLFRLDGLRLAAALRRPALASALAVALPLATLGGLLWAAGPRAVPELADAQGAVGTGLLAAGPAALSAYGVLFRGGDDSLLRHLGIPGGALFAERAVRLLALCLAVVLALLLPFLSADVSPARPLALLLAAALAAWGAALWALCSAALAMARPAPGRGRSWLAFGIWDRELADAVALVYAPLAPLLAGAVAAGVAGAAPGVPWVRTLLVLLASLALAAGARRAYVRAMPRFAPQALEMTFAAPPPEGGELYVGRGAARLLPRQAAAAWARDAVVARRRMAWATRIVWPVAIVSLVGLARWGEEPATHLWVTGAASLALLAQAAAAVGLGRLERQGRRWLDRSLGLTTPVRFLGRWAWGWGASLWLTFPLALAWSWWSGAGSGWGWMLAGAATAALGALASLAVAGWR